MVTNSDFNFTNNETVILELPFSEHIEELRQRLFQVFWIILFLKRFYCLNFRQDRIELKNAKKAMKTIFIGERGIFLPCFLGIGLLAALFTFTSLFPGMRGEPLYSIK